MDSLWTAIRPVVLPRVDLRSFSTKHATIADWSADAGGPRVDST